MPRNPSPLAAQYRPLTVAEARLLKDLCKQVDRAKVSPKEAINALVAVLGAAIGRSSADGALERNCAIASEHIAAVAWAEFAAMQGPAGHG